MRTHNIRPNRHSSRPGNRRCRAGGWDRCYRLGLVSKMFSRAPRSRSKSKSKKQGHGQLGQDGGVSAFRQAGGNVFGRYS
jgi:hypothetical protein